MLSISGGRAGEIVTLVQVFEEKLAGRPDQQRLVR